MFDELVKYYVKYYFNNNSLKRVIFDSYYIPFSDLWYLKFKESTNIKDDCLISKINVEFQYKKCIHIYSLYVNNI